MEDITKLLLRYRALLKSKSKIMFKGKYLISFITSRPEISKSREELVHIIRTHFANANSAETYIIAQNNKGYVFGDDSHKYMFLDAYLAQQSKNSKILNLRHVETYFSSDLPVFFAPEKNKHPLLAQPLEILRRSRQLIDRYIAAVREKPQSSVAMAQRSKSDPIVEQYIQLVHLLPFIDAKALIDDINFRKAFMSELLTVMKFYMLLDINKEPGVNISVLSSKKMRSFSKYYFNIAGTTLSLKNIEKIALHGGKSYEKKLIRRSCFGFLAAPSSNKNATCSCDINKRFLD